MNVNRSLKLCLNLNGIWEFFWTSFFFSFNDNSMNLFDQLVIVICDPNLRGLAPFGKNPSLGLLFVVS